MFFPAKLKIGEVSKLTGLSQTTLNSLEKRGLIHAERTFAGQRIFDLNVIEKLKLIYGVEDAKSK